MTDIRFISTANWRQAITECTGDRKVFLERVARDIFNIIGEDAISKLDELSWLPQSSLIHLSQAVQPKIVFAGEVVWQPPTPQQKASGSEKDATCTVLLMGDTNQARGEHNVFDVRSLFEQPDDYKIANKNRELALAALSPNTNNPPSSLSGRGSGRRRDSGLSSSTRRGSSTGRASSNFMTQKMFSDIVS